MIQERGNPNQGAKALLVLVTELLQTREVTAGTVRRLVEGKVNDDPPLLGLVLERVEGLLADIGILEFALAVRAAPAEAVAMIRSDRDDR